MDWKRMKGITEDVVCPKCHGTFNSDEYDYDYDLCFYCLYPETTKHRPADIDHTLGYDRNLPKESQLLENIEYIKEKQSIQSEKAKTRYDYKKKKRKTYK